MELMEQETNTNRSEENEGAGSQRRELLEANLLDDTIDKDEELREIEKKFKETLEKVTTTTSEEIEEKERLMKIKRPIEKDDLERGNKILEKYLEGKSDMCKVIDAVYAMARTILLRKD